MDRTKIQYYDRPVFKNPGEEVLKFWENKGGSTVGALYDLLVQLEYPVIADLL